MNLSSSDEAIAFFTVTTAVSEVAFSLINHLLFLLIIDMNPSDLSCIIYSQMKFICAQAGRYRFTPIITFDQPLWWVESYEHYSARFSRK